MKSEYIGDTFIFGMIVLLIGSIVRIGASIYLPAMPLISKEFHIGPSMMSNTLTIYFFVFASFIVVAGVLSDRYGRKPLLIVGMFFFIFGSIICAMSDNYEMLLVGRAIEAFGASMIPGTLMAMIQDGCSKIRGVTLIGWLAVLGGLFLVAAPIIGGILTHYLTWRANFWFLAIFTSFVFILSFFHIKETHTQRSEQLLNIGALFSLIVSIITSGSFTLILLPVILFFALQGAFLALAPYIVMQGYGLSPVAFGISNISIVIGLFMGRWAGAYLLAKYQSSYIYRYATYTSLLLGVLFLLFALQILSGLWNFLILISMFSFVFGMVSPVGMKSSINAFSSHSGIAAALQGAMLLGASAIGSIIAGTIVKYLPALSTAAIFGTVSGTLCIFASFALFQGKSHKSLV